MMLKFIIIWYELQVIWDFTWKVSDCEDLVGVTQMRWC